VIVLNNSVALEFVVLPVRNAHKISDGTHTTAAERASGIRVDEILDGFWSLLGFFINVGAQRLHHHSHLRTSHSQSEE
jgi:hypothetical protein